jgi:large subunit ribosomal protein L5e
MPFVKVIKNKPYFKRFQVKYRRRREGKTDYRARRRLVLQDKNKYNSPKYRLVVRITNKDVICQIVYSKIVGDFVLAAAYSHELPRYGLAAGLTNWAAAYATGLLLARRVLKKLHLDSKFRGIRKAQGEDFNVEEPDQGPRPFKAILDVGLARTTTGARVFAALKGATDGGLNVPHSPSRWPGYDKEGDKLDAAVLRKYIFGGHVGEYMDKVKAEDPERYEKQFSQYIKAGISSANLEEVLQKTHLAIRANPVPAKKEKTEKKADKKVRKGRPLGRSLAQRRDRIKQKLASKEKAAA